MSKSKKEYQTRCVTHPIDTSSGAPSFTIQEDRASGIYPESAREEWLNGPSSPEVIAQLRDMLTRSGAALQGVIQDRNRYKQALEVVRDDSFTSRAEMRHHARQALKAPEGKKL